MKWMLVAITLAIGACTTQYQLTKEPTVFELACQYVAEEVGDKDVCEGLEAPQVIQSGLVQILGALGVYVHGERIVYVAPSAVLEAAGVTFREVQFHETVHYISWFYEGLEGCESEARSRKLTDKLYGREYDDSWRVWYGCNAPWLPTGMGAI